MFLERVVQGLERGVVSLGRCLCQPDARTQLREDMLQVRDDLATRQRALARCRDELEGVRSRVNENQAAAALLAGRIGMALARGEGDQAWRRALELDKLRRRLAEDEARLPKEEQLCAALELQVRFLTRKLARLQDQLYRAV
jgi:chromosome segregation ATPase